MTSMPSQDAKWIIGAMVVLTALVILFLYVWLGPKTVDFLAPAVPPDPQAVLCYEATGNSAIAIGAAIDRLIGDQKRYEMASCIVGSLGSDSDYRRLHFSLQRILQQYGADNLAYILVSHDLRESQLHYTESLE